MNLSNVEFQIIISHLDLTRDAFFQGRKDIVSSLSFPYNYKASI